MRPAEERHRGERNVSVPDRIRTGVTGVKDEPEPEGEPEK
jgi:hypothetical protein